MLPIHVPHNYDKVCFMLVHRKLGHYSFIILISSYNLLLVELVGLNFIIDLGCLTKPNN